MFIDTHAHLYLPQFDQDRDEMIQRAFDSGVHRVVMPAIDIKSIEAALVLADQYDGLYVMSAIHPSDVKDATDRDFEHIVAFCAHPKVVAVGESGLDYYWDRTFDEKQQDFFRRHIRLAIEQDLPLVIHNREASEDVVRLLREEKRVHSNGERLKGIFHCFSGPVWVAEAALDLGFHLGLGGVLTYKKSTVPEDIARVPLDRLVLETDAPFLAPQPRRGKRNEPSFVPWVAEKLAEVKGVSVSAIAEMTTRNAEKLFRLPPLESKKFQQEANLLNETEKGSVHIK
ncbi:MAG: TatD family hydrolase [Bacteroidetes Order II. Incertae sedis bacterium]|nr:TatD family hydrolase [Bacteroidetes Order II. bacterium]